MPKLTLFDELTIIDRINILRMRYEQTTGRLPTRLILTPDDLDEFTFWLTTTDDRSAYMEPPYTNEPEIYGMTMRIETYAKTMRVYFQES